MDISYRAFAAIVGILGVFLYFRSIVRVMLLNRRERDFVEVGARFAAVHIVHSLVGDGSDYNRVQRMQAWALPLFIFFSVTNWFLLVQFAFAFILWGLHFEQQWLPALSSSGSALSTLGYKTPPTLGGEFLAIYEAAIGLAVVIVLFTFAPGYLAAIQVRERKVGWLYARTGRHPTSASLLESLKRSGHLDNFSSVWEDWEVWFRGVLETHSISPILAYVPAIYRGTTWVGAAAAVLDATSLLLACSDSKQTEAVRICRETGVTALRVIATELHRNIPEDAWAPHQVDSKLIASFDHLYAKLVEIGLPVKPDKDECRTTFIALRAEYEASIRYIAQSTLMPIEEPWVLPHAKVGPVAVPN